MQIRSGGPDPFQGVALPRLDYVLRGIKKHQARQGGNSRPRLPMTPHVLRQLKAEWNGRAEDGDTRMIWAACCLAFCAFLRAGELTVPGDSQFDPGAHLTPQDIAIDDPVQPTLMRVTIKQSKTDPLRQGVDLYVGRTGTDLCPVAAVLSYLERRGKVPGPLFVFQDGRYLTRARFVERVREGLKKANVNEKDYCGHSFRIGAATTAASRGIEDSIIKTLGRWESVAYLRYVQIAREQLTAYTSRLLC